MSSTVSFDFPANMVNSTTTSGMTLTVVDDDVLEDAEVFEGIFAIPVQVASQIKIKKGMTQVTSIIIEDNDGMRCGGWCVKVVHATKVRHLQFCCAVLPHLVCVCCLSVFACHLCVYVRTYVSVCCSLLMQWSK